VNKVGNKLTLTDQQREYLNRIGLTKEAIRLYELLLNHEQLTAQQAADLTGDFPSAEYRLFYLLESKELVRRIQGRPIVFDVLPLSDGLAASFIDTKHELKTLISQHSQGGNDQAVIIVGRQALYDEYVRLQPTAKHEICIFAIGVAYTKSLADTQKAAVNRGVRIRHVVQQKKHSNFNVIDKWLRTGVKLRYFPSPRGYHVSIFDDTSALITFSDPEDTENRITIATSNHAVVAIFQAQFDAIWQKSKPIKF
jgi:sugar-specific transcriptional regulator TrmB